MYILLITLSLDVEYNAGPPYPCGTCSQEVKDSYLAVDCGNSNQWFHIDCHGITQDRYNELVGQNTSFSWVCSKCVEPNYSSSGNTSLASLASINNYSILSSENSSMPISPPARAVRTKAVSNHIFKLKVLNVNCQSIVNKKAEFHALLDHHNPDVVIGTESWLTADHLDSEYFSKFQRLYPI